MKIRSKRRYLALIVAAAVAIAGKPDSAFSDVSATVKSQPSLPKGQISHIAFGS